MPQGVGQAMVVSGDSPASPHVLPFLRQIDNYLWVLLNCKMSFFMINRTKYFHGYCFRGLNVIPQKEMLKGNFDLGVYNFCFFKKIYQTVTKLLWSFSN